MDIDDVRYADRVRHKYSAKICERRNFYSSQFETETKPLDFSRQGQRGEKSKLGDPRYYLSEGLQK